MALSKSTLEDEIRKVIDPSHEDFVGFSTAPEASVRRADAAEKWADAFDAYGRGVENVNEDTFLSEPNRAGFEAALTFETETAEEAATEFGNAWTAYWTGLTFVLGTPGAINGSVECPNVGGNLTFGVIASSLVTAVNSVPLVAALKSLFEAPSADPAAKAAALADALHNACVGQVTVLTSGTDTTPPPGGPIAITNTCRLF
jgi:hypothetical protein